MSAFIRRFLSDPGIETLVEIESVNILDLEPPAQIVGVGSGTLLAVGEFENGPFAPTQREVTSSSDYRNTFGSFGYVYNGVEGNNPCARAHRADSALTPEYWNGNAFVQLAGKKFRRLICVRVDTSVGQVEFSRLASVLGGTATTFDLEPGQTVVYNLGTGVADVTSTFSAAAAALNSAAGTYPTTFAGGESITIVIDESTPQQIGPVTVTFLVADTTQTAVINRINAALGYTALTDQGGGVTRITSRVRGTNANARVTAVSGALVTTATGFSVAAAVGTGNVGNIDAVTVTEVDTVITGTDVRADRDANGRLRLTNALTPLTGTLLILATSTALSGLGLTGGSVGDAANGYAQVTSAAGTYPNGFVGGETLTLGFDTDPNVVTTFIAGDTTIANTVARINATLGFTAAVAVSATRIRLQGRANGGQVRVVAGSAGVFTALGLAATTVNAVANQKGFIPAGTRVRNSSAVEWVTMQDVVIENSGTGNAGPKAVKVRPATDDGTALTSVAASVSVLPFPITLGAFSVTNPNPLTAALTEAQLDAAYVVAIGNTKSLTQVGKEANLIVSARQSNIIRTALRDSALEASANGCRGRIAIVRPPFGTTRAIARGSAQPGIGAYRNQRLVYAFPGVHAYISQMAALGTSGGAGYAEDGIVNVGFDFFIGSVCSQLAPEENPGQETDFLTGVLGLESGNSDIANLDIVDYTLFKASGIAAPRIDEGTVTIQSGCTSVDPNISPNLKNIARRRMADFIQDSEALRLKSFSKKLNTRARRIAVFNETKQFVGNLQKASRIDSFLQTVGSDAAEIALGVFRIIQKVRTQSSLDSIVLETTIGENVITVAETG